MRRSRFSLYRLAWVIGGVALAILLTSGGIVIVMRAKMETTRRVVSEALQLADSHDYANALPRAEQALALVTEAVGATSEDAAFVHAILASIHEGTGAFDKAERAFNERLKAFEGALGPDHDMVAHTLSRFGDYYDRRGLYDKGEPLKRRALAIYVQVHGGDDPWTASQTNNIGETYRQKGRFREAESYYLKAINIYERLGDDKATEVSRAALFNNLGATYANLGRFAEAETALQRSLSLYESANGPDSASTAEPLSNLSNLRSSQGRSSEAESYALKVLAIREAQGGADSSDTGLALNNLGVIQQNRGQYTQASLNFRRGISVLEKAEGPEHPRVAQALSNYAILLREMGDIGAAETTQARALRIKIASLGENHPDVAISRVNLAAIYFQMSRIEAALRLIDQALESFGNALASVHSATALGTLATVLSENGRAQDVVALQERVLAIKEQQLGPDHPDLAVAANNLAITYAELGRNGEAELLIRRSLAIVRASVGPEHLDYAAASANLGAFLTETDRPELGRPILEEALVVRERLLSERHRDVATTLLYLGRAHSLIGNYAEAAKLERRALALQEVVLGPMHPDVASSLNHLGALALAQRDWSAAVAIFGRSAAITRTLTSQDAPTETGRGGRSLAAQSPWRFAGLIKASFRNANTGTTTSESSLRSTFEDAQWALATEASASLTQMAARSAAASPELAELTRTRQDLVRERTVMQKSLLALRSEPTAQHDLTTENETAARLNDAAVQIAKIDARLAREFQDYATLVSPASVPASDLQALLSEHEALVLFLDTDEYSQVPEETFIWVVTKRDVRWVRSEVGTRSLQLEVAALRCGLDYSGAWRATGSRCKELTGVDYTSDDYRQNKPLPFDPARANALYKSLFGEVEDLMKGKHLLVVPSGPLTQLPFQVLVTAKPSPTAPEIAWLARSNAITVLPAVSSLKALRQNAKASAAKEPFIGFGNPVLTGHPACGKVIVPESCPEEELNLASAKSEISRSVPASDAVPKFYRDGLADVAAVRALCPLPDTAYELNCVAKSLGAPSGNIVVGNEMTETVLKKMPLNHYRVIHFATHGLLAGDTAKLSKARAEPALVMSPPDIPTEEDDGLLTASEISGLKLDADWVVMSACNTAGGNEQGAETLSGLARAFFYAGARALLVSHWPVNSYAATMLTSRTFAELRKDVSIGRSEGFRRAMVALMDDKDRPWAAHPSVWAPFVVVGEGAALR